MKQLITEASRARALADENPLLEPDAAFYEAELAATKKCAPTVAVLMTIGALSAHAIRSPDCRPRLRAALTRSVAA